MTLILFWPFYLWKWFTRPLPRSLRFLLRLAGYPAVATLYLIALIALAYGFQARFYDLAKLHAMPERSVVLDRRGEVIGRIHGEKRASVPLNQVAVPFRMAIIAREDERFYHHPAVDPLGILRAIGANLRGKREGASTITQQLAADAFQLKHGERRGDHLRQLNRKCLEIALAFRIESRFSKDEILEAYLNQINWGRQIRGIGEAARIYFEKHPSELTLSESAMLAGIVRGPDAFNPFKSLEAAIRERDTTLTRMVNAHMITAEEADRARAEAIEVRPEWRRQQSESYAMDAIRRDLEIILERENIELGGLTINTTIDLRLQHKGEETLDQRLRQIERTPGYPHQTRSSWRALPDASRSEPSYLQGAIVLTENRTGAVLAVVGGRDANESKYNRATQSRRQLGSLFKPFVYLTAFERGLRPDTSISDGPIQPGEIKGAGTWRPRNSDGRFGGMLPASHGLIRSRNTMSVRVGNFAGLQAVAAMATTAGFQNAMPRTPSSFLGSWEGSPWEVATAYSMFPNQGLRFRPFLITEIKDRKGNVLYSSPPLECASTKAGPTWAVSRILTEVTSSGTAAAVSQLGFDKPCGGKTGTTNDFKDAWFAGFTSNLSCAVWVGFDQPRKIIQGGYGASLALPVWVDLMKTADRLGYKAGALNTPVKLVECQLCRLSGKRATPGCEEAATAYKDRVPSDTAPSAEDFCPIHPARAVAVEGEPTQDPAPSIPRALPVENPDDYDPPRALEVGEEEPYGTASTPPRALPVE